MAAMNRTVRVVDDFTYECICESGEVQPGQRHSTGCIVGNAARQEVYARDHDGVVPLMATLPAHVPIPWDQVRREWPKEGRVGVTYSERDPGTRWGGGASGGRIQTLTHRNNRGRLTGVLYHYPVDFVLGEMLVPVRAGSVNLWVDPARWGRGVATALAEAAFRRWPDLDLTLSEYTEGGLAVARVFQRLRDGY